MSCHKRTIISESESNKFSSDGSGDKLRGMCDNVRVYFLTNIPGCDTNKNYTRKQSNWSTI